MADQEITLTAKVVADTSAFKKGMADARKALSGFGDVAEDASDTVDTMTSRTGDATSKMATGAKNASKGFGDLKSTIAQAFPTFGKMKDTVGSLGESLGGLGGGAGGIGGGFLKAAGALAIAAVAVKAIVGAMKKVAQYANQAARAFDPQSWDKAQGKLDNSLRKFKTAVGAFLSPLVNGIKTVISWILDGITTVLKVVWAALNAIVGFIQSFVMPIIDAVKGAISWIVDGLKGLLGIDTSEAVESVKAVGEAAEYTEGALLGFDKLTVGQDSGGNAETASQFNQIAKDAQSLGKDAAGFIKDLPKKIAKALTGVDWGGLLNGLKESLEKIWDNFAYLGIKAWDGIKWAASSAWAGIRAGATYIWDGLSSGATMAWDAVTSIAGSAWQTITSLAGSAWDAISGIASSVWGGICDTVIGIWETASSFIGSIFGGALESVKRTWTDGWNGIKDVFTDIWTTATEWLSGAFSDIFNWIVDIIEWIQEKIEDIIGAVTSIPDAIGGALGGAGDFLGDVWGGFTGLFAAEGDVIRPSEGLQTRIVGDNNRETEVISPLSTIRQAVSEAMAMSGGGSRSGPINISLEVDGRVLARTTYDDFRAEGARRGQTIA